MCSYRKKAEQQEARDAILGKKEENAQAGGALGQTGEFFSVTNMTIIMWENV